MKGKPQDNLLFSLVVFMAGAGLMFAVFIVCSEELALYDGALVCHATYEMNS